MGGDRNATNKKKYQIQTKKSISHMDSTRQNKIARLIQKELSDILLRLAKETRGIMVSVSVVRVSPDLGIAKAYLSVFPSEKANEVVNHLNENVKAIRFELGNRVRHQLRIIPEVRFYIDDSLDYIENIDKLLKE